jgi:hypothetical protein
MCACLCCRSSVKTLHTRLLGWGRLGLGWGGGGSGGVSWGWVGLHVPPVATLIRWGREAAASLAGPYWVCGMVHVYACTRAVEAGVVSISPLPSFPPGIRLAAVGGTAIAEVQFADHIFPAMSATRRPSSGLYPLSISSLPSSPPRYWSSGCWGNRNRGSPIRRLYLPGHGPNLQRGGLSISSLPSSPPQVLV